MTNLWPDGYDTGPITGPIDRLLSAAEADRLLGVNAASVRNWKRRGHLHESGHDQHGRPLYWESDLLALRDRTRTHDQHAAQTRRRKRST